MNTSETPRQNTPSPTESRANYGFALYLASKTALVVYLVWAFIPNHWLTAIGQTYFPQKYWAIAIPIWVCCIIMVTAILYPAINMLLIPPMNDPRILTDSFARPPINIAQPEGIPTVSDLNLSEVCKTLYLNSDHSN